MNEATGPGRILTAHLFRPLAAELIGLLRGLEPDAWTTRTSAGEWTVRDVAAHLLDVEIRRLSAGRDAHPPPPPRAPIAGYDDLVSYLNALNAEWVDAARRMSPRVITDLLDGLGPQVADLMEAADPDADALFPVAWAGQTASPMWLDIGREYTERWHHQDQIREAVGAAPLAGAEWIRPVIEVSLIALPHAYRSVAAPAGTRIAFAIGGAGGGDWHLENRDGWRIAEGSAADSACVVRMDALDFARLLMHRLRRDDARAKMDVEGDAELAEPLLHARAVMV